MIKKLLLLSLLMGGLLLSACSSGPEGDISAEEERIPFSAANLQPVDTVAQNPQEPAMEEQRLSIDISRANAITNAVEKASRSVVSILATEPVRRFQNPHEEFLRYFFGGQLPRENSSMGSGFIISEDGLVVTNQHVVGKNPSEITVSTIDGNSYRAKLIGSDELTDLALLRIESDDPFPYLSMTDSDEVIVGEWSIALGNPFGLFDDGQPTVTVGVISAKNRDFRPDPNNPRVYIDMLQTDAAINMGNSGGPLLNSAGEVIGINTFIYTGGTSGGFVGLGFAIPSNRIERIISQLLNSGVVMLDYDPGMEFTSMTEQLIYRYRLPYVQGLLVTGVNKGGPAFEGGIMPGDVIVKIGDERVVSEMHAWALLRDYDVGDRMKVELIRDSELYEAEMTLRQKIRGDS
ncbi:MAG: trypsin-like peptidase domain-containing protein [Balneolaceae bacterium]|nr:trypsin-like peptidase domain-containing protein [Balneolaceae bacterium]